MLDEAVGRRDVRRTLRKLRRVGVTAAPVGLALRRAYAKPASGPALEDVATEVVRVPTLNGERGARRAAPARGRRRDLARQRDHPARDVRAARARRRSTSTTAPCPATAAVRRCSGSSATGSDRVGFTIHLIDAGIDTGPVLARGEVPIERRGSLAATLAATIPRLHEASLDALEAVLDAAASTGEPQPQGGIATGRRRRSATTSTCGRSLHD